jgi:alpha-galactosidase
MLRTIRIFSLSLLAALFLMQCGQKSETIRHHNLQIEINDQMHVKVNLLNESAKPLMNQYTPSEFLVSRDRTIQNFSLDKTTTSQVDDKIGKGTRYTLKGVYEEDGFRVRKIIDITTYEDFKDIAFMNTRFINEGDKYLPLEKWVTNQLRVLDHTESPAFYSFQSESTSKREDWIKPVDKEFYQKNYQGMNSSDYGGGIPVTDLWRPDAGISIGHTALEPKLVSIPVEHLEYDDYATMWMQEELDGQKFESGDTLTTLESFVMVHEGDAFKPLRTFSNYMRAKGINFVEPEEEAFEPIWCAWGYGRDFTVEQIVNTLPKVKEMNIPWVVIDDGFQQAEGDWQVNRKTFPSGEQGMKDLVDKIHSYGMKAKLWWAPLAADPGSKVLEKDEKLKLINKEGAPQYITWWDAYYMSPAYEGTREHTREVIKMFMEDWGFDGLKMDGQHMNMVPPDYNYKREISSPKESISALPEFFKMIHETATRYNKDAVVENCPCGTVMNYYNMPYMNQAVSSDPLDSWQIRLKGKVYKAVAEEIAYYGDHVELSDNGEDFASSFGIGAVLGTKFTWPEPDNTDVAGESGAYLLTPEKEKKWKKWFSLYNDMMLSKEEYLGTLYDIGYDKPETHVIQKADTLYYAFYADQYEGTISLRGLEAGKQYKIHDYVNDQSYGVVSGDNASFEASFDKHLLVEVYPEN